MMMEPVMQENGPSSVPLHIPEKRGALMAYFGDLSCMNFQFHPKVLLKVTRTKLPLRLGLLPLRRVVDLLKQ